MTRFLPLVLLLGCGDKPLFGTAVTLHDAHACSDSELPKLERWVAQCIKDANPHADEEPEDWIIQCERTGIEVVCPTQPVIRYSPCNSCFTVDVPCTEVTDPKKKALCP